MNSSKSMRHRHQVFGNALGSCRQSLLEDSGPRCPIDCDEGAKKTIESRFENTFIQSFTTCRGSNMGFSAMGFGCRTLLERANPVSSSLFSAVAATSGPA